MTGSGNPGKLYVINPAENGPVQVGSTNLGVGACAIAFDGDAIWTANPGATPNLGTGGSVSLIGVSYPELNPMPWTAFTVTTGFKTPNAVIYDGTNIWVSDYGAGAIFRMNKTGSILQTVTFAFPGRPTFDGTNLWVPGGGGVVVVRASTGAILTTLTGFGLQPIAAAFDGERVLVTSGNVWLWKAADLSFLGTFDSLQGARGVCSDGQDFWVTTDFEPWLARF